MESEDYAFYKGLEFLMDNKVEQLGYDLTFSTEISEFGVTEVRDMIPNGRDILVTEANKMDYIRLVCQTKMTGAIRKQVILNNTSQNRQFMLWRMTFLCSLDPFRRLQSE